MDPTQFTDANKSDATKRAETHSDLMERTARATLNSRALIVEASHLIDGTHGANQGARDMAARLRIAAGRK